MRTGIRDIYGEIIGERWEKVTSVSLADDIEDWSQWDFYEGCFETRAEAIDAALGYG